MKKSLSIILSVLVVLSMLVFLSACGEKETSAPVSESQPETAMEGGVSEENPTETEADENGKSKADADQKTTAKAKKKKAKLEPSTSQMRKKNVDKTRPASLDFKAIAEEYGTVSAYECADFDGDGSTEAFAVITFEDETVAGVVFIDSLGKPVVVEDDFELMFYMSEDGNLRMYEDKGFFWFDMGAEGSGWKSAVYSVKNGKPYKLDISDELQGFYEDKGRIYTTENGFSDEGHIYNSIELIYNSKTQQFKKGGKIKTDN